MQKRQIIPIVRAVAPLVGAWIEIAEMLNLDAALLVAPLVGAWIEIVANSKPKAIDWSLPSWERGLKYTETAKLMTGGRVAPLVGAWIEISR